MAKITKLTMWLWQWVLYLQPSRGCHPPGPKIKNKTGNLTLVEDTKQWTEKFRSWKKPTKDGKTGPRRLPGVLSPRKNDNSMTSDSGLCPSSLTKMEFKHQFFDEPEFALQQRKYTTPWYNNSTFFKKFESWRRKTGNDTEATSWEASIAKKVMTTPKASSPYPDWPGTLEQLEPETDDEIIDITDYTERPPNDKRAPEHIQKYEPHSMTQGSCPTPQTSPNCITMNMATGPAKPHHVENPRNPSREKKNTPWMACMSKETTTQDSIQKQWHLHGKSRREWPI